MPVVFLGIGSNLGVREANLDKAVAGIRENIGTVMLSSSVYETEPWGFKAEINFLNMVLMVDTNLTPSGLLGRVLMIESFLGRVRGKEKYSSRIIDIDILFYDGIVVDEESLKIPHPLLAERRFVLFPLSEIASEMIHPILRKSVGELLKTCKDNSVVKRYKT